MDKPIDYDLLLATVDARLRQIERIHSAQEARTVADVAVWSATFGLTPAEKRMAHALTEGKTLAQIADGLSASRTTIAFHLRNIFQKTGTERQAELVALLLKGR